MKITCIKCGKKVSGLSGLQKHMKLRHTAPYGNRRDPTTATTLPPCPVKKKLPPAKPTIVATAKKVNPSAAEFNPREAAECPNRWIPPPEARTRPKVSLF